MVHWPFAVSLVSPARHITRRVQAEVYPLIGSDDVAVLVEDGSFHDEAISRLGISTAQFFQRVDVAIEDQLCQFPALTDQAIDAVILFKVRNNLVLALKAAASVTAIDDLASSLDDVRHPRRIEKTEEQTSGCPTAKAFNHELAGCTDSN